MMTVTMMMPFALLLLETRVFSILFLPNEGFASLIFFFFHFPFKVTGCPSPTTSSMATRRAAASASPARIPSARTPPSSTLCRLSTSSLSLAMSIACWPACLLAAFSFLFFFCFLVSRPDIIGVDFSAEALLFDIGCNAGRAHRAAAWWPS
jgi:hypothetical protein